jgi:hypothetical protein
LEDGAAVVVAVAVGEALVHPVKPSTAINKTMRFTSISLGRLKAAPTYRSG